MAVPIKRPRNQNEPGELGKLLCLALIQSQQLEGTSFSSVASKPSIQSRALLSSSTENQNVRDDLVAD
jgi:hypothetical protein